MDELSMLRKKEEILQQQNSELAQSLQRCKSDNYRLEMEKINLLVENFKYKQQLSKFKSIKNSVRENLSRSLADIVNCSNHIRKIIENFDENGIDLWGKSASPLPARTPLRSNASNVNHVHPMVQGVTIKKPIIRISRASLNTIERLTGQSLTEDQSTNSIQALVEDSQSDVIESIADEENVLRVQQITNSPTQLLDLRVSLNRLDMPSESTARRNISFENSTENVSQGNSIIIDSTPESQDTESLSQNSGYSEEQEASANIISAEVYDCKSRLDCIFEESETESMKNWVNPRRKDSPFSTLSNSAYDVNTLADVVSSPCKQTRGSTITVDDPMEGTSWHFNTQNVNVRAKCKISPKKNSLPDDIINNNDSLEGAQVPDSTTSGLLSRDSNQEQDQSFVKSFPSVLEFQSTPVANPGLDQSESDSPLGSKLSVSPVQNLIDVKVVLSKMRTVLAKSKKFNKKKGKPNKCRNLETPPKKRSRSSKSESSAPEESSLFQSSSIDNRSVDSHSSRPRRGESKNYKEKPLNKKMRRSK